MQGHLAFVGSLIQMQPVVETDVAQGHPVPNGSVMTQGHPAATLSVEHMHDACVTPLIWQGHPVSN